MSKGKRHSTKTRSAAIALVLTGFSVSDVAKEMGLDKSVISRWKSKIPAGELQRVATKKSEETDD